MIKFYTTKEVAEILKVSVPTVRLWYNTGKITGSKISRTAPIRFTDKDLEFFDKKGREL